MATPKARRGWALALLLALSSPVPAQRADPPGSHFRNPNELLLNEYWLGQRGVLYSGEWLNAERGLYLNTYPSWFSGELRLEATRLLYRENRRFQLVLGTQMGLDLDSIMPPLAFNGARLDYDLLPFRLTFAAGSTTVQNLPYRYSLPYAGTDLGIASASQTFNIPVQSLGLATRLNRYGEARLAFTHWANPGRDSQILSLEVDPRWSGPLTASGAYGMDLQGVPTLSGLERPGSRRAYRWDFAYRLPWVQLAGQQTAQGLQYGPDHVENFNRGNNNLNLEARFPLTPELSLTQAYRSFHSDYPFTTGAALQVDNRQLDTLLLWQPSTEWQATAQYQASESGSSTSPLNHLKLLRGEVDWRPNSSWAVALRAANQQSDAPGVSGRSFQWGGEVGYQPGPQDRAYLRYSQTRSWVSGGEPANSFSEIGGGYTRYLDDDGSNLGFDASQTTFSGGLTSARQQGSLSLFGEFRPTPRLSLGGNLNWLIGSGVGGQNSQLWGVRARYVVDEHQELALSYGRNPFFQGLLGNMPGVDATQLFTLELRQSWGGGLERRLHDRLQANLKVRVEARPPDSEAYTPVSGARVVLTGKAAQKTDKQGRATFPDLPAGRYHLDLEMEDCYEIEKGPGDIEIGAGQRREQTISLTAYSSLTVVTWNRDPAQKKGTLPVGYVPVAGVAIQVNPGQGAPSDENGSLLLRRLAPGTYQVAIDPKSLPPGYRLEGPSSQTVKLTAGAASVVDFPVVARARLKGRVVVLPPIDIPIPVELGGQRLGLAQPGQPFDLEVPAGKFMPRLEIAVLGPDYYLAQGPTEVTVLPDQSLEVPEWVVHRYAQVEVSLEMDGKPLLQPGIPLEVQPGGQFLYTNEKGVVLFQELKAGSWTVLLDPQHAPPGARIHLGKQTLSLRPGQRARVVLKLGKP